MKEHKTREVVLVVDDDPMIVEYVVRTLTEAGYAPVGLTDSRQVPSLLKEINPIASVLDMNMPHVTGPELLTALKETDADIEVVFLTANDEIDVAIELMKRGAADYLLKPVQPENLLMSLSRALEHRRLVCENNRYRQHLEHTVKEKTAALNHALAELKSTYGATLDALGGALDFRDQSTSGHSRRVAGLTVGVARKLGITGDDLIQIEYGSFLHDIGKLKIPDHILWKPGPLTPEEWIVMREHAQFGYEFLQRIEFLNDAAEIVYAHHEKFDGSGYPRGLSRGDIHIGARIFSIVDAIDAMVYDRPYQPPQPFDLAKNEIRRCAGSHFDPSLVDVALDHLSEIVPGQIEQAALEENSGRQTSRPHLPAMQPRVRGAAAQSRKS